MRRKGLSTASVCEEREISQNAISLEGGPPSCGRGRTRKPAPTNLGLYVPEVDAQLLQQRRLALVALRGEGGDPARPQPALLAHAPGDPRGGRAEAVVGGAGRCAIAVRGL